MGKLVIGCSISKETTKSLNRGRIHVASKSDIEKDLVRMSEVK